MSVFSQDDGLTAQGRVDGDEEQLLGVAQAAWQTDTPRRAAPVRRLAAQCVHALCWVRSRVVVSRPAAGEYEEGGGAGWRTDHVGGSSSLLALAFGRHRLSGEEAEPAGPAAAAAAAAALLQR